MRRLLCVAAAVSEFSRDLPCSLDELSDIGRPRLLRQKLNRSNQRKSGDAGILGIEDRCGDGVQPSGHLFGRRRIAEANNLIQFLFKLAR